MPGRRRLASRRCCCHQSFGEAEVGDLRRGVNQPAEWCDGGLSPTTANKMLAGFRSQWTTIWLYMLNSRANVRISPADGKAGRGCRRSICQSPPPSTSPWRNRSGRRTADLMNLHEIGVVCLAASASIRSGLVPSGRPVPSRNNLRATRRFVFSCRRRQRPYHRPIPPGSRNQNIAHPGARLESAACRRLWARSSSSLPQRNLHSQMDAITALGPGRFAQPLFSQIVYQSWRSNNSRV